MQFCASEGTRRRVAHRPCDIHHFIHHRSVRQTNSKFAIWEWGHVFREIDMLFLEFKGASPPSIGKAFSDDLAFYLSRADNR